MGFFIATMQVRITVPDDRSIDDNYELAAKRANEIGDRIVASESDVDAVAVARID